MLHIHHVPGRLRVRVSRLKRNPSLGKAIEMDVQSMTGVRCSESNPLTGSVVIHYDPAQTTAALLISQLRAAGYASDDHRPEPARKSPSVGRPARKLARKAAEAVVWHVIETAVERSVPLLLFSLL